MEEELQFYRKSCGVHCRVRRRATLNGQCNNNCNNKQTKCPTAATPQFPVIVLKSKKHHQTWNYFLVVLLFLLPTRIYGNWMYLGVSSLSAFHGDTCNEVPGLVWRQVEVCRSNPQSLFCISEGARRGIQECKEQFRYDRWNCTTQRNQSVFGQILSKGSKETAFIYAVLSAGVVHAVTQSCSAGNLTDCSCDINHYGELNVEGWEWGGCSDNIHYGTWFCKMFVDAPDLSTKRDSRNLMNIHNNEVGRKIVEKEMKMQCRCHGVSGSCAVRTCWRSLPLFHEIGSHLKRLHEDAVAVAPRSHKKLRRRDKIQRHIPISDDALVYIHRSRNYCRPDPSRGIIGTKGRLCNKTVEEGPGSCNLLCCGRGYNTQVVRYVNRCHCKFHWCCFVTCKTCETMADVHTCK